MLRVRFCFVPVVEQLWTFAKEWWSTQGLNIWGPSRWSPMSVVSSLVSCQHCFLTVWVPAASAHYECSLLRECHQDGQCGQKEHLSCGDRFDGSLWQVWFFGKPLDLWSNRTNGCPGLSFGICLKFGWSGEVFMCIPVENNWDDTKVPYIASFVVGLRLLIFYTPCLTVHGRWGEVQFKPL